MTARSDARAQESCALCGARNSTPDGEHVLPRWLMRDMSVEVDKHPEDPSRGREKKQPFEAIKLACCKPCNDELNRRFENPGRYPARALLADGVQTLSGQQADRARLWVLKTWVLLTHPRTEFKALDLPRAAWPDVPGAVYDWLRTDQPPPDGLSAWAFWLDDSDSSYTPEVPCIDLPTVHADGARVRFRSIDVGVGRVTVALVFHPGWQIAHPGEADGSVVRLWPAPTESPVPSLPRGGRRPLLFRTGMDLMFAPETYGRVDLPPLDPDFSPFSPDFAQYIVGGAAPKIGT